MEREQLDLDLIRMERPGKLLRVHEALDALAQEDPQCVELVKLHYFGGYSLSETADLLNISRANSNRWWTYAKAFLKSHLH